MNNYLHKDTESNFTEIDNDVKKEKKLIKYTSYKIYEMIGAELPSCCKTKKFKYKESLINQSHKILNDKLDIFLYIRNMLLFDSIKQIYLENKSIVNFMSRPIIYLNKKEEKDEEIEEIEEIEEVEKMEINKDEEDFYKYTYKLDYDKIYNIIQKLAQKPENEKTKIEKIIIYLLKRQLREVK